MNGLLLLLIGATYFGIVEGNKFPSTVGHKAADSVCSPDWISFKDEKCFKILDDIPRTFSDAEKACTALESSPTLAIIHTKEEQDFLSNYLFKSSKKLENFWIGAKSFGSAFKWVDDTELGGYSNWDSRALRNKPNYCVQIQFDESVVGKWIDEPCETKNYVVCQKMVTWSLERLQKAFLNSKKELNNLQQTYANANAKIEELEKKLENVHLSSDSKQNSIPIGFVYSQLPNEKPPSSIWPSLNWTDVSSSYKGVFFRVEGGGSEAFGRIQEENDWRVARMESTFDMAASLNENSTIDSSKVGLKTNQWIYTGDHAQIRNNLDFVWLRFVTKTGEVRPRNMAIRVWKRTG